MDPHELRQRLGMVPEYPWLAMRMAYATSRHEPLMLTGHRGEEPLTVTIALQWAERLAREVLDESV